MWVWRWRWWGFVFWGAQWRAKLIQSSCLPQSCTESRLIGKDKGCTSLSQSHCLVSQGRQKQLMLISLAPPAPASLSSPRLPTVFRGQWLLSRISHQRDEPRLEAGGFLHLVRRPCRLQAWSRASSFFFFTRSGSHWWSELQRPRSGDLSCVSKWGQRSSVRSSVTLCNFRKHMQRNQPPFSFAHDWLKVKCMHMTYLSLRKQQDITLHNLLCRINRFHFSLSLRSIWISTSMVLPFFADAI